jgi:hypothetical protein
MSIETPNVLERIKFIENRLNDFEKRLSYIENLIRKAPYSPHPLPDPRPKPSKPGPMPEPFRF